MARRRGAPRVEPPPAAVEDAPPARPFEVIAKLLPELSVAGTGLAYAWWPERLGGAAREGLYFIVMFEVFFCMGQGTLTDIATRLRKRPPWWMVFPVVAAVLLVSPDLLSLVRGAFAMGWWVLLPFLWSLLERLRELWTMPGAPTIEKLRRRALVSGRIALVLVVGAAAGLVAAVSYFIDSAAGGPQLVDRHLGWWMAAAFGVAALDVVRVHRPSFAQRPRALVPGLDPLGVTYLAPP